LYAKQSVLKPLSNFLFIFITSFENLFKLNLTKSIYSKGLLIPDSNSFKIILSAPLQYLKYTYI